MRGQHRKVEASDPTGVSGRFLANSRMVREVASEKTDRRSESDDHARHVTAPGATPDEIPSSGNKNGAHEIKRGVDSRQIGG